MTRGNGPYQKEASGVIRELFELRLHGPVKSISIMTRHLLARGKKIGL